MITRAKIDEWIRQVEAAPVYAPILIRQITERLLELDAMNESMRAENLELSNGNRVKQYEARINELEFQLDLLKRQIGKESPLRLATFCNLVLYNDRGQLLRLEVPASDDQTVHSKTVHIKGNPDLHSYTYGIAAVVPYDQLLLVFNSGRTAALSVDQIPPIDLADPNWQAAYQVELRSLEELSFLLPITRMHLADQCLQTSRFGYARKFTAQYFNTFISNNNIGKGTKFNFDRILNLILCNTDQTLVLATHHGSFLSLAGSQIPISLGEVIRLKVKDYLVSAFALEPEKKLACLTQAGTLILQKSAWLELAEQEKHKAHQLSLKEEAEESLAGAVMLAEKDWLAIYREDGELLLVDGAALKSRQSLWSEVPAGKVLALTAFSSGAADQEGA